MTALLCRLSFPLVREVDSLTLPSARVLRLSLYPAAAEAISARGVDEQAGVPRR
jgi:hypothetical protein